MRAHIAAAVAAFVAAALASAVPLRDARAQASPPPRALEDSASASGAVAVAYFRDRLGFSDRDLARIERGVVVTRVLAGATAEEAALAGVARLPVSPTEFVRRFRMLGPEVRSPRATQFGAFSDPPASADLERYVLPGGDFEALRACLVGACKLKLPREAIARLRALSPDATPDQVSALVRGWLLEYVLGYRARGNAVLVVYDDARRPLALHEGFHALLAESPSLAESAPEFHHYLDEFSARPLAGVEDRLYWSVEEFGLRPLTTIMHAAIYMSPVVAGAPRAVIALKQVYASHYFHAGLSTLMLFDAPSASGEKDGPPGSYLVWVERSLFDTDRGGFTRRGVVGSLETNLQARLRVLQRPETP